MEPEQINSTPVTQSTVVEEQIINKPSKLLVYLLFILIILGLASWAGVYLKKENVNEVQIVNETDNWKTYRNEEYGFEFKYPESYDIEYGVSLESSYENGVGIQDNGVPILTTGMIDEDTYNNSNRWLEGERREIIIKVGGRDAILNCAIGGCKNDNFSYYIIHSTPVQGKILTLNFGKSTLTEKILSTFKFIDETDVSTWKTYRNEEYGYEFKYPNGSYIESNNGNIRIQNYNGYRQGLASGEFWLDFNEKPGKGSCQSEATNLNKKQDDSGIYYIGALPFTEMNESGGERFVLCADKSGNSIFIQAFENNIEGPTVNQILSTFKFISEKYKVVNDSFMEDGKLIEVNADGSEKVLISSFKTVAPKESYRYFNKLSFPENSNKLYFYSFLDGTDAPPGGVYSYNLLTREFNNLPNISEYYSNYGDKFLSPNGMFLATLEGPGEYSNKKIFLLDLENDKITNIVTLSGKESVTFCSTNGDCWGNHGDIKWIDNKTIEYKVYDSLYVGEHPMSDYPEIDKRRFSF